MDLDRFADRFPDDVTMGDVWRDIWHRLPWNAYRHPRAAMPEETGDALIGLAFLAVIAGMCLAGMGANNRFMDRRLTKDCPAWLQLHRASLSGWQVSASAASTAGCTTCGLGPKTGLRTR